MATPPQAPRKTKSAMDLHSMISETDCEAVWVLYDINLTKLLKIYWNFIANYLIIRKRNCFVFARSVRTLIDQ